MRRLTYLAVAVAIVVAIAPARAGTPPAWTIGAGIIAPAGIATGNATCTFDTVRIDPQQTTIDYTTQTTSGSAVVESDTACMSTEPGLVADTVVALYQQKAIGGILDPGTLSPWPWMTEGGAAPQRAAVGGTTLVLIGSTRCYPLDPLTMQATCRGKPLSFKNGPGTRIVAIAWTTYTLIDPRGGAWIATHPFCEVSTASFMKMTCVVAAELRS